MIREATFDDAPWLVALAQEAYAGLFDGFDAKATDRWVRSCIADFNTFVVRGETHAGFANVYYYPWAPTEKCCDLLHLYGRKGWSMEPVRIVAALDKKRRAFGCSKFYVGSIYADLAPIAKRLGGRPTTTMWVIE